MKIESLHVIRTGRQVHQVGFLALMFILQHCYEFGLNYVTIYAFRMDNFKNNPDEVELSYGIDFRENERFTQ